MNSKKDILIFTNGNIFALIILHKFMQTYFDRIYKVVIITGDYKGRSGLYSFCNYISSTSFFYVLYKINTLYLGRLLKLFYNFKITNVIELCDFLGVNFQLSTSVDNDLLFNNARNAGVNYLISVSCPQLIRNKWLNLVNNKGINIHSSLLPSFSGLAPYFWVLSKNQTQTGISVHYLTKSFDRGDILRQEIIPIRKNESCLSLFSKQSFVGSELLIDSFQLMLNSAQGLKQSTNYYSYYSHPKTLDYFNLLLNGFSLINIDSVILLKKIIQDINLSCMHRINNLR